MNEIEFDFMKGMVSILNEAAEAYHSGNAIITNEQYDVRLEDLKQLEEETGVVFANSPTFKSSGNVSEKTSYLVCNSDSDSSEFERVKELGVKVITEDELIEIFKINV